MIPALDAGGSNIKTAQALLGHKPIIATPHALRGYEDYQTSAAVHLCRSPAELQERIAKELEQGPAEVERPEADALRWPNALRPAEIALLELLGEAPS